MWSKIGGNRGPGVSVSRQRFGFAYRLSEETWEPTVEPVGFSGSIPVELAHCCSAATCLIFRSDPRRRRELWTTCRPRCRRDVDIESSSTGLRVVS